MATVVRLVTNKVRFSYLNVFKPRAIADDAEPKYSVTLLIPKSDKAGIDAIKAAINQARKGAADLFGGKVPATLKSPLHDGDQPRPRGSSYGPEARNCYVLEPTSKTAIPVVDRERQPILDQTELYSGCYGRASIAFRAYKNYGNTGIGVFLNAVQKLSDGEALGGNGNAADDFDDDYVDSDDTDEFGL